MDLSSVFGTLLVLAFITASVSFTIAVTSIFNFLRVAVSKLHPKLDELIHCPYCLGHYIAIGLLLITGCGLNITGWLLIDFALTVFAIMGMTACLHYVILRAYEPVQKAEMMRAKERSQQARIDAEEMQRMANRQDH